MTHEKLLQTTPHVALIGDSVFDSRPYLRGAAHMAERLTRMASPARATLLAVSGSRLADIRGQLDRIPDEASHVVASIGGNDVIDLGSELKARGLAGMRTAFDTFAGRHATVCARISELSKTGAICTIYQPQVADPALRALSATVLGMVNATIVANAGRHGLDVIDLRPACRDAEDFFDPIHPSALGADKIAAAIAAWIAGSSGP